MSQSTPVQSTPAQAGSPHARSAIVTGAAKGLGRAIARELASRGERVALCDVDIDGAADTEQLIRETGGHAEVFGCDVSDEPSVQAVVAAVAERLGPPLILVNNAGVLRDDLLFKMPVDNWDTVMNVHLRGAFLMSRAAQGYMVEHGWGRIINLSSTSALGNAGQANYAAAKAGIQGFTKTLALELGRFGVTANAVAPGFTVTDMTRAVADRLGIGFDELVAREAAATAVHRVGTPEDIAHAVAFFASPHSGFVSGQVLYVAGGPRG
ncbi:3-oxoacyl-[acyl-carrier protein] reductase [Leucobacter luti]|uniref:3-oxoacyl-[acyl-carrier protein] reductase n=1 Tax=Leucobacter luti TaxID=340320 RepID=A0A4R6S9V6_9MICO|nr:SDR family oxidoreductase [Leucobacter luti]MCW2288643.1 3-oxoacyl-[acyl-carrier protein] reductase [Leucobacter luti]TCK45201.1 3-oxoacyl-[acyl-carrier protein] reductase [Leucobacter luti]TDP95726.1 3-oxoacyl-[acyl-carrier protein] reductase [Leucobacter luti]